jgi:hypothetical protein
MKKVNLPQGSKLIIDAAQAGIKRPIKLSQFIGYDYGKNSICFRRESGKPFWLFGLKNPSQIHNTIQAYLTNGEDSITLVPADLLDQESLKVKDKSFKKCVMQGMARKGISNLDELHESMPWINLTKEEFMYLIKDNTLPGSFNSHDGKDVLVLCFSLALGSPANFKDRKLYWIKVFKKFFDVKAA